MPRRLQWLVAAPALSPPSARHDAESESPMPRGAATSTLRSALPPPSAAAGGAAAAWRPAAALAPPALAPRLTADAPSPPLGMRAPSLLSTTAQRLKRPRMISLPSTVSL